MSNQTDALSSNSSTGEIKTTYTKENGAVKIAEWFKGKDRCCAVSAGTGDAYHYCFFPDGFEGAKSIKNSVSFSDCILAAYNDLGLIPQS